MTNDGNNTLVYDAENRAVSATNGGFSGTCTYDGDGRRVAKANTATPPVPYKLYWYGAGGDILSETDASGNTTAEYIFFGGSRIAMLPAGGTPLYYVEDLLGTSRVITSNTGVVCYDADFYPYGGERPPYTNTCTQNNYKFEGKERDTETGNDDFGARYYSNRFGRWLSADWSSVPVAVPYANLTNPQTLNLYAMVADDPESFADLDGHFRETPPTCKGKAGATDPSCSPQSSANTTEAQKKEVLALLEPQPLASRLEPVDPEHPDPKDPKFKGFKTVGDYDGEVIHTRDGRTYVWVEKNKTWRLIADANAPPTDKQKLAALRAASEKASNYLSCVGGAAGKGVAKGAVGGAIWGAKFGSILGPPGTLAGAAGGALGGTFTGYTIGGGIGVITCGF